VSQNARAEDEEVRLLRRSPLNPIPFGLRFPDRGSSCAIRAGARHQSDADSIERIDGDEMSKGKNGKEKKKKKAKKQARKKTGNGKSSKKK
jgi:hypothetical protein